MNNNQIKLKGKLNLENAKTFTSYDEQFVECKIEVKRKSETIDVLPIVISEKLFPKIITFREIESGDVNFFKNYENTFVSIVGEIRTFNKF